MFKKLFLTALAGFTLASAQTVTPLTNGGFETWQPLPGGAPGEQPAGWFTNNIIRAFHPVLSTFPLTTVKETPGAVGNFGMKVKNGKLYGKMLRDTAAFYLDLTDTVVAGASFTGALTQTGIIEGMPFTQRPDSIRFSVKINYTSADTGQVFVSLQKSGATVGATGIQPRTAFNLPTWTSITIPMQYANTNTPDTLYMSVISSISNRKLTDADTNNFIAIDGVELIFNTTVGVEVIKLGEYNVFPNPATEALYIYSPEVKNQTVTLSDLAGKVVYTGTIGSMEEKINVSNYTAGAYIYTIKDAKTATTLKTGKVIVQ